MQSEHGSIRKDSRRDDMSNADLAAALCRATYRADIGHWLTQEERFLTSPSFCLNNEDKTPVVFPGYKLNDETRFATNTVHLSWEEISDRRFMERLCMNNHYRLQHAKEIMGCLEPTIGIGLAWAYDWVFNALVLMAQSNDDGTLSELPKIVTVMSHKTG